MSSEKKHVFIIGSKGIPAQYGGFETFVEKLTEYQKDESIQYYVACMNAKRKRFKHNGAKCFNVTVPDVGPAKAVYYDIAALKWCIGYIKAHNIKDAVIYVLACRIGPFIGYFKKQMDKLGAHLYVNPDGHEWLRAKWNGLIKKYWKISEKLMVKHAELLICDSMNIEKYIQEEYKQYTPNTTFIAYGADITKSKLRDDDQKLVDWYKKFNVKPKGFYLVVGRFVPENNYETMVREFMNSDTDKDFVLITNVERNKFYEELREKTGFEKDKRIKFVGTVYDQELLKKIREDAYGYFHGHEVGGTNPSLLEALGSTQLNLLLDVGFNREVAEEGAMYWSKDKNSLSSIISSADQMTVEQLNQFEEKAKKCIIERYTWENIRDKYERVFLISE